MMALVPVRDGVLPTGAAETIAECAGRVIFAGSETAALDLDGIFAEGYLVELGSFEPARWAAAIAPLLNTMPDTDILVLPNSPDGRDLAPRLAFALDRPLLAAATEISADLVRVARRGGLDLHEQHPAGAFIATLEPGVRGPLSGLAPPHVENVELVETATPSVENDAVVVEVLPADVHTMDLSEAARIVGGGAGLESEERFHQLTAFAAAIGGVMGATRVITDRSWVHHDRQIGTTGVVVDPEVYVSFGVSGAVQHTSGLGQPAHILSVNTDAHCPMMAMSDLAIVSDANATLEHLATLLQDAKFDDSEFDDTEFDDTVESNG
jgi:electron transfer flavoprotein alpha subunit